MSVTKLFNLIERIGNLVRSEEKKKLSPLGLQPIHLQVLNYLSVCNKYSNNPMAISKYLGNTKGTTSQTINVLESKGYIRKEKSQNDKREVKLEITSDGLELLKLFSNSIYSTVLNFKEVSFAENVLEQILAFLQKRNDYKTFGVCKTCSYFLHETNGFRCGLTKEQLYENETDLLCHEHKPKAV